jgi:hypothetical protein
MNILLKRSSIFGQLVSGLILAGALILPFESCAVADLLRIKLAQDIGLNTWSGSGDKVGDSDVCIYHSLGSSYAVTATGSGAAFELTGGGHPPLPYNVAFKGSSGTGGSYTALPYFSSRSFSGADTGSETCSGGYNANVRVTVTEADLSQAASGSYLGTLIITLTAS